MKLNMQDYKNTIKMLTKQEEIIQEDLSSKESWIQRNDCHSLKEKYVLVIKSKKQELEVITKLINKLKLIMEEENGTK